ncbi:MAG: hypothetical protein C0622_00240 [Desulfuromonas sp.]|nr:MAG: hypothetical protein C0622_00240 [Desulfuromonas sp.]
MNRKPYVSYIVMTLLCWWLLSFASAMAQQSVAWVEMIAGNDQDVTLIRASETLPVAIYTSLSSGDEITVNGDTALTISYADGQTQQLTRLNTPIQIDGQAEESGFVDNMLGWLGDSIASWSSSGDEAGGQVTLHVRGEDDAAGIVQAFQNDFGFKLSSDSRELGLRWLGGTPPFSVRFSCQEMNEEVHQQLIVRDLESRHVTIEPIDLLPGDFCQLEVSSDREIYEIPLEIVASEELPHFAPPAGFIYLNNELRTMIHASWLLQQGSDWSFAAYQMVQKIAPDYPPADKVARALEEGKLLSP